jgi:Domain of unknown function (DUF4398)
MNTLNPPFRRTAAAALATAAIALVTLAGCASTPAPTAQLAVAEAAVQRASTSSTSDSAAGELQLAVSKLASARQAMKAEEFDRARQLAEQVTVDAQAAEMRAQSVRSQKAAAETQDAARVLQEEINRKSVVR